MPSQSRGPIWLRSSVSSRGAADLCLQPVATHTTSFLRRGAEWVLLVHVAASGDGY